MKYSSNAFLKPLKSSTFLISSGGLFHSDIVRTKKEFHSVLFVLFILACN